MHVLIATGGAEHSEVAVQQVALLATMMPVEATVITVVRHEKDRESAERILDRAISVLKPVAGDVTRVVRVGQPAVEIVKAGEAGPYDLVVLGQRPNHSLFTRLSGSVNQYVAGHSGQMVLIVKSAVRPLSRILICDSGVQQPSLLGLLGRKAPQLLAPAGEVSILHVMSQMAAGPGVVGHDLRAETEELIEARTPEGELLERDVAILEDLGLHPRPVVRHGLVRDEIVAEAAGGGYDLVVIGAHRDEGLPQFLLDDHARDLVESIDATILVVR